MKHAILISILTMLCAPALAQADQPPLPPDWITASNQPCKIWNPQPQADETVTWSGECKDGYASGQGELHWFVNGKPDMEFEGMYNNGKRNGAGVIIMPDGARTTGVWIDDKPLRPRGGAI